MKHRSHEAWSIGLLVVALVAAMSIWVVRSYFEARSFTRVTGEPVSTWEAMWVELRVQSDVEGR